MSAKGHQARSQICCEISKVCLIRWQDQTARLCKKSWKYDLQYGRRLRNKATFVAFGVRLNADHLVFRCCDWRWLSAYYYGLLRLLKRTQRSIAFPACALITQVAAEAIRLRIKPYRSGLAFALLTRKPVAA